MLAVTAGGCTASRLAPVAYPAAVRYAAAPDSLGLDAYLALPTGERAQRRHHADRYATAAATDAPLDLRIRHLNSAVGLAPDHAPAWLLLLEHARWFGDDRLAEERLAGLRGALAATPDARGRELRRRAALTMAWICYDRGDWLDGLAWADSAEARGGATLLVRGLLLAGSGQFLYAEDVARQLTGPRAASSAARWIHGMAQWFRGNPELAQSIFELRHDPELWVEPQAGPDAFIPGELRPEPGHAAECWRDLGALAEAREDWHGARDRYERSFAAVPGAESRGVTRVAGGSLAGSRRALPVWLAFDRYYVTGSLSAYTRLAYERYAASAESAAREFWAATAIDAAGTCVRRGEDTPWALRVRGLLQVASGRAAEGREDLEAAWRLLRQRHREDYATAATLGHLYLKEGRGDDALPLLRAAVRARPDAPVPWADLGLALILSGDLEAAAPALDRALDLDPELAVGWYNRGLLYYHARRWDEAVVNLERAAALAPADPDVGRVLAQARQWQRRAAGGGS